MSDDEEHSDVEEVKEVKKPSEAELALQKRRAAERQVSHGLDDAARELLEANRQDRDRMEKDIEELRQRNVKRKKEREQFEKRLAAERGAEEDRRKAVEEEKRHKKEEEDQRRQQARAKKQAEFEKLQDVGKRNFVISSSSSRRADAGGEGTEEVVHKKSKEQLEAERKAILKQRIQPLEISGFDAGKLGEKAKELHKQIFRLEGEKYDLEKRYRVQQHDMQELAERARQANKVGKRGLKRVQHGEEEIDTIQTRFAGAPAKVEMFSKYERQKDKRPYSERQKVHSGPQFLYPPKRIPATKIIKWGEDGLPVYEEIPGAQGGHGAE